MISVFSSWGATGIISIWGILKRFLKTERWTWDLNFFSIRKYVSMVV